MSIKAWPPASLPTVSQSFIMIMIPSLLLLASLQASWVLACPGMGPSYPEDTVVQGTGPVPQHEDPNWMSECAQLKMAFKMLCGATTDQPYCSCASGDQWRHPYFYGACGNVTHPGLWQTNPTYIQCRGRPQLSAPAQTEMIFLSRLELVDN